MLATLLYLAARCLAATWRVERPEWPVEGPCVIAFWHGEQLPLILLHRHISLTGVASRSRDGELLARVLLRLGYAVVRGSSSQGALAVLRECRRVLEAGGRTALAVDGPRGPRGKVQPGAEVLAKGTKVPVVTVRVAARGLRLRSWDHFLVPWPFAKVQVRYATWRPGEGPLRDVLGDP